MRMKWGRWLTKWVTLKKRLPSLAWAATLLLATATDANVIAVVPERWHFALRYVVGACTVALLYTRSVATGAHGADYGTLVADRRGTGSRTGEMKASGVPLSAVDPETRAAALAGLDRAAFGPPDPQAPHGVADAGTHAEDGTEL